MLRAQAQGTYLERLFDFASACRQDTIPKDVRETASLFLLDALGVAVANRCKPFLPAYASMIEQTVAEGPCTVIGFSKSYVAEGAAAVNATAIHGNDFDPTHLPSVIHPSPVVIPVVLALAEEVRASGSDVLSAIIAGFEILIRMGLATRGAMHKGGFQSTALCAPIALTMIAGKLYGMPCDEVISAAGMSTSVAAGLRAFSDDGTWGKRIIMGWSCRAALMATALARENYPGSRDALEKERFGFYRAFVPGGGYDLSELTKGLGQVWETRDVQFKRYPCAHGHHAFINTARRAKAALELQPESIASVAVHVSSTGTWWFEPRERRYELPQAYAARFSMPYTLALALVFGDVTDEHLESRQFLDDPRVRRLAQRIAPKVDNMLQIGNPNILRGDLDITITDGLTTRIEGSGSLAGSDFKNAVFEKFRLNTRTVLGDEAADKLIGLTMNIEGQRDITEMMSLLKC